MLRRFASIALVVAVTAGCMERPVTDAERGRVLTIAELEPYGLTLPDNVADYETFSKERWFDGSIVIEYEFSPPDNSDLPYLSAIAERHVSHREACVSFRAGNWGLTLGNADVVERNDLYQYGAASRFGLLRGEDGYYGNYFGMCNRQTTLLIIMGGFYFDDGELWAELVERTLKNIAANW